MNSSLVPMPSFEASRFAAAAICSSCRTSPGNAPALSVRVSEDADDLSVSVVMDVAAELDVSADSRVLTAVAAEVVLLLHRSESPRLQPELSLFDACRSSS